MAAKVYGFDEQGFKRVQEATRRTLGTPRVGSQRTARQPVLDGREFVWFRLLDVLKEGQLNEDDTVAERVRRDGDQWVPLDPPQQEFLIADPFFRGVGFGPYPAESIDGDIVQAVNIGGKWYAVGEGRQASFFEIKHDTVGGGVLSAWALWGDSCTRRSEAPEWGLSDSDGWTGMAWGTDPADQGGDPYRGDKILGVWNGSEFVGVGSGTVYVEGVITHLDPPIPGGEAHNAIVEFTQLGHCYPAGKPIQIFISHAEDYDPPLPPTGETVRLVWHHATKTWVPLSSINPGCGLTTNDDGELIFDAETVAGCGLVMDGDCGLKIDNEVLAGTGLDPEGTCALRVEQSILDRIQDLEDTVDAMAGTLADHEGRIADNEQCCYDNTKAIEECCYGRVERNLLYDVECDVYGNIVTHDVCVIVKLGTGCGT